MSFWEVFSAEEKNILFDTWRTLKSSFLTVKSQNTNKKKINFLVLLICSKFVIFVTKKSI